MIKRVVTLTLIAFVLFLVGCGEETESPLDSKDNIGEGTDEVSGAFAGIESGSWAEYQTPQGRQKMEFIGTDTYKGTECYILEIEMIMEEEVIMQVWIDKKAMQTILLVMKQGGMVMKMDIAEAPDLPTGAGSIPASSEKLGSRDYTTPTGKKVKATAYKIQTSTGVSEVWISNEVPFRAVKDLTQGQVVLSLYDFGTSGAVRDISKQEAENAKTFDELFGGDEG